MAVKSVTSVQVVIVTCESKYMQFEEGSAMMRSQGALVANLNNEISQTVTSSTINKTIITQEQGQYQSEVTIARLGDRVIRLENLTPILSLKDKEEREREIESRLYGVFVKYTNKTGK